MSETTRPMTEEEIAEKNLANQERLGVVKIPMAGLLGGIGATGKAPWAEDDVDNRGGAPDSPEPTRPENIMEKIVNRTEQLLLQAADLRANVSVVVDHFVGPTPAEPPKETTERPDGFLFTHHHILGGILDDIGEAKRDLTCLINAIRK